MKLGDKEIKTGLEVGRDVHAFSVTEKIEERIRQEIIKKYGKILSPFEIQQITGREKERQEKRKDSLERSRVKILKMKDKAILIQNVRRAVQEGTLFKQRVKPKREIIETKEKEAPQQEEHKEEIAEEKEETEKPTETIQPTTEQFSEEEIPPEQREESQPEEQQPTTPAEEGQRPSEESSSEESQEETEEEKKDEPQSKPNIKPRDFDY